MLTLQVAHATHAPVAATMDAALRAAVRLPPQFSSLILGSQSPSRRALLAAALGHGDAEQVECIVPDIDEKAIGDRASDPERLVLAVATAKADALVARLADEGRLSELGRRGAVLVCGDQVVTYNGAVREKPADADEARAFIADYGLAPCSTVGALVLHDAASGRRASGVHVAHIHFDPFPPAVVDALAADPVCRRCAGGLMVEHPACVPYLRQIDGGVDSVMGLSTRLLATLLGSLSDGAS